MERNHKTEFDIELHVALLAQHCNYYTIEEYKAEIKANEEKEDYEECHSLQEFLKSHDEKLKSFGERYADNWKDFMENSPKFSLPRIAFEGLFLLQMYFEPFEEGLAYADYERDDKVEAIVSELDGHVVFIGRSVPEEHVFDQLQEVEEDEKGIFYYPDETDNAIYSVTSKCGNPNCSFRMDHDNVLQLVNQTIGKLYQALEHGKFKRN